MIELSTDVMNSKEPGPHVPAIEFQTVSKSFGAVQALHETFELSLAEVQRERPIGQEAR